MNETKFKQVMTHALRMKTVSDQHWMQWVSNELYSYAGLSRRYAMKIAEVSVNYRQASDFTEFLRNIVNNLGVY